MSEYGMIMDEITVRTMVRVLLDYLGIGERREAMGRSTATGVWSCRCCRRCLARGVLHV